ncbi:MAG: HTH-type transcriptional regulator, fmd operon transcriptional regulator [Archaeoglobi archaeon]|nr:HTH-type transcriptional regulator, fmd operon transcriptional regulator [Archaeoglobi archaeon]
MMVRPFLTDEQIEVLRLRMRGLSQKEIAEILKTTRANVCIIEKRARRNIERALKTIEIWKKINSRAEIEIPSGTDLMDIPQIIFEKANENDVKVKYSFLELIEHIKKSVPEKIEKRVLREPLHVYISEGGEVLFD